MGLGKESIKVNGIGKLDIYSAPHFVSNHEWDYAEPAEQIRINGRLARIYRGLDSKKINFAVWVRPGGKH